MNSVLLSFFCLCFEINASMISKKYLLAGLIVFGKPVLYLNDFCTLLHHTYRLYKKFVT